MEVPVKIVPLESVHWPWVAERASPVLCKDTTGFVALRDSQIVGAVVFDSFTLNSCLVHIAVDDSSTLRQLLQTGFEFAFEYAERGVLLATIRSDNEKALAFNTRLGFTEVCRIRDGYAVGVDYVIRELRKEDCKWIRPQEEKAA